VVNPIEVKFELNEKDDEQVRTRSKLCLFHQNIRSLWGKSAELEILLETDGKNIDVLCFTEHWLNRQKQEC
jgi:hypothetical protein